MAAESKTDILFRAESALVELIDKLTDGTPGIPEPQVKAGVALASMLTGLAEMQKVRRLAQISDSLCAIAAGLHGISRGLEELNREIHSG